MATTRKTETADVFAGLFKFPNFDVDAALDAQRKNIEALVEANRIAFDGYKAVIEKQSEAVRKLFEDSTGATRDALSGKTPEANAQKQFEVAQGVAKSGFESLREVADLTAKTNRETFAVIQKRFSDSVEEIKAAQAR